jgi:pantoate--beta-alanine ligase
VTILFNIVRPDFAFFGQKDAQQAVIIRRMVKDLSLDTEVLVLPTVREDSGLAMSSRNSYLSAEEQQAATVIHRALVKAKESFKAGERHAGRIADQIKAMIEGEPRVRLDYVGIVDGETLERLDKLDDRPILIAVAAFVGKVRLIDNTILNGSKKKDASSAKA